LHCYILLDFDKLYCYLLAVIQLKESNMSKKDQQSTMTETALLDALKSARERIGQAEIERSKLEAAITAARKEERLLVKLLELRGVHSPDSGQKSSTVRKSVPGEKRANGNLKRPLVDAVLEELTSSGRPVHISELMRMLRTRGIPVPGLGTQANLISYLRREPQFVRTSRGMYALSAWGLKTLKHLNDRSENKLDSQVTTTKEVKQNEH
jgi:hypothetical protein